MEDTLPREGARQGMYQDAKHGGSLQVASVGNHGNARVCKTFIKIALSLDVENRHVKITMSHDFLSNYLSFCQVFKILLVIQYYYLPYLQIKHRWLLRPSISRIQYKHDWFNSKYGVKISLRM